MLNAKINLICYFASFITAFFTRKILLDHLGTEFIGFTGTVGSLLSFLNLAELGIGTAVGYVLYKPIADGDKFKINEVISVLGYLYRIIGLAILSLGIIGSLFLPLIFNDTTIPLGVIYFAFYAYLASSLLGYFANYRATLLSADQRNYIVTGYFQATTTGKVILQMTFAIYFKSFIIYLSVELFFGIINSIILNWKINKTYPWLKSDIKCGHLLLKKYPEIIKYIKQIFAHKVGWVIQAQLSPILIYYFASLPIVALYTNYTLLTQRIESLISATINSAGAAIGNLIAEGNKENTLKVFKELLALRMFITTIVTACIYEFLPQFIELWLGKQYILGNATGTLIAILCGLNITRGAIDQFNHAFGLYGDIWAPYIECTITIVFAIIGGQAWGLPGILLGSLISTITINYIWKPYYLFSRGFKKNCIIYWRIFITHLIIATMAYIISIYFYDYIIKPFISATGWIGLIIEGALYLLTIALVNFAGFFITSKGFRDICSRLKFSIKQKHH